MTPLFLHAVAARLAAAPAGSRPALLDIGANHGWFSNLAAAAGFAVAAFEPVSPENRDTKLAEQKAHAAALPGGRAEVGGGRQVPEHCEKIRQSLALNDFGQEQVPQPLWSPLPVGC